jgi:hypothetical protein
LKVNVEDLFTHALEETISICLDRAQRYQYFTGDGSPEGRASNAECTRDSKYGVKEYDVPFES